MKNGGGRQNRICVSGGTCGGPVLELSWAGDYADAYGGGQAQYRGQGDGLQWSGPDLPGQFRWLIYVFRGKGRNPQR